MATYDSAYYYKKYKSKKSAEKTYEDNNGDIQKIKSALTNKLY